jgi:conjugal transfer pilus assembly protein TraV
VKRTSGNLLTLCGAAMALAGCTSIAGLGGSSSYSCQAPEGVTCNSVSGVYANAVRNNLPAQQGRVAAPKATPPAMPPVAARAPAGDPAQPHDELRSRPRLLRLWFKAWEDIDGDLFDQGYVYVQIDAGQWRVDHVQRRIREAFAPVRVPARGDTATPVPETRNGQRLPPEVQDQRQVPRQGSSPAPTE